jgi:hypothetical protein
VIGETHMVVVSYVTHHRIVEVIEHELMAVRRLSDDETWRGPTAEGVEHEVQQIGHLLRRMSFIALDVERRRLAESRF